MTEVLLVIIAISIVGVIFWKDACARNQKRDAIWETVAQDLGLEYRLNPSNKLPQLSGVLDGVPVNAEAALPSVFFDTENDITYAVVTVPLTRASPLGLRIHRKQIMKKAEGFLSGKAIKIGDDKLDAQFIFYGDSPQKIRDLVRNRPVKYALLSAQEHSESMHVEDEMIHIKERGADLHEESITTSLHDGVALATAIKNATHALEALDAAPASTPPRLPPLSPTPKPVDSDSNHW